jgi:hypothetical protein
VDSGDVRGFADAVERLLDDDDLRVQLGLAARARVAAELDWASQRPVYVRLFDQLLGRPPSSGRPPCSGGTAVGQVPRPSGGRRFVPLDDPAVLAQYVRDRGRSRAPSALEAEEAHSA